METILSSLHSLHGKGGVSLEMGTSDGVIALFSRASKRASPLVESQLYAQFPDSEIEEERKDPFVANGEEVIYSAELLLSDPEVFPIRRHPQFVDMSTRQQIDPLAGSLRAAVARSIRHG